MMVFGVFGHRDGTPHEDPGAEELISLHLGHAGALYAKLDAPKHWDHVSIVELEVLE